MTKREPIRCVWRGAARSWLLLPVALVVMLVAACGVRGEPRERRDSSRALDALTLVFADDPQMNALVAPRKQAFLRAADTSAEDADTRGRIVSEGWRSTRQQRFSDMGARLPDAANGVMDVGLSRFSARHVRVTLAGASADARAVIAEGRVVYPNALVATDRVVVSNASTVEELLVLHDGRAPRAFTWNVQLPELVTRVRATSNGGHMLEDARGKPVLVISAPSARDAHGKAVAIVTHWDDATHALRVTLSDAEVAYPVVIDPRYETSVWVDSAQRIPSARNAHAMAFDSTRGEVVLFGGFDGSDPLDDTWVWGSAAAGSIRRSPATSPPARSGHAMAFDSARGEVVLFAGRGVGISLLNDTWVWSGATAAWTRRSPAMSPPARSRHAMAFDSARGEVVLFGGFENYYVDDTWVWSGATASWTQRTPATSPTARDRHALAFDSTRGEVVLFGGDGNGDRNDTWVWSGINWVQRTPAAAPPPRESHALAFDSTRGEVVLFGGRNFNDTWVWNGSTWTRRFPATFPSARTAHALAFDSARGEVVFFGGYESVVGDRNDTWVWSGTAWAQRTPVTPPPPRSDHALAFDSARDEVVLFGGSEGYDALDDTWVWSGRTATWTRRTPALSPPARSKHALAFDSVRGEVVLFGGDHFSIFGDTWVWSGATATWTRRNPVVSPAPRGRHALAFDSARGEVVLFGGWGNAGSLDDTWVWTGANASWTRRSPVASPSARFAHALAFDSARDEVVLFGGAESDTSPDLNDTWVWSGSAAAWTRRNPTLSPRARRAHALAFDSAHGEVVLFGGFGGPLFDDTWVWRGDTAAWARRTGDTSPAGRAYHAMAFDDARGEVMLFGGSDRTATTVRNDTWLHVTLGGTCTTSDDCSGSGSFCTDGVCCDAAACGTCETCASSTPGRCVGVTNAEDRDTCAVSAGKSCSAQSECKIAQGSVASVAAECATGFLVDGVCCNEACLGCQACAANLKESGDRTGICGAAKVGTDPHDACDEDAPPSCMRDGLCDGRGACRLRVSGAACGDATCVNASRTTGQVCDGFGICTTSAAGVDCTPFACTPSAGCVSSCAAATDCAPLHRCENGACVPDQGARCDGNAAVDSAGRRTDCGAYRCVGATCLTSCSSISDCTGGAVCTFEGRCALAAPPPDEAGGCNLSTRAPTSYPAIVWLLLSSAFFRSRRAVRRTKPFGGHS